MRDERDGLLVLEGAASSAVAALPSAIIIPFPNRRMPLAAGSKNLADDNSVSAASDAILMALAPASAQHAPTLLAAIGAITGFAIQQMLLLEGGHAWAQPKRAEHLDRLLLSESERDGSLWFALQKAAHATGAQHLPDPNTLLQSTLRCVGTTQFGLVTLPLEYKLLQQPQASLCQLWAPVSRALVNDRKSFAQLPNALVQVCARRVAIDQRVVPPHVALRIIMQSALAMALIEARTIPGAALKPHVN